MGKGGFSIVSEIQGVTLDDVYDTSDAEAKLRQTFAEQVHDSVGNTSHHSRQYVLKMLRTDLPEEEHTKGVVDLAIEAEFLKTLRHPNIITMRAHANSDPHETRFFVILEKLVLTLERKMNFWRQEVSENAGVWIPCVGYCCSKQHVLHRLWMERLMVSRDISMAIRYLHTQGIVYRDLVRIVSTKLSLIARRLLRSECLPKDDRPLTFWRFQQIRNQIILALMLPAKSSSLTLDWPSDWTQTTKQTRIYTR